MDPYRKIAIEQSVIRAMTDLGDEDFIGYKSMNFVGLSQCCRGYELAELVQVLKSMDGVIIDIESYKVRIPYNYFPGLLN